MEHLSKHLEPVDRNCDHVDESWMFNATLDDRYRESKKVNARKEALYLASKVDRSAINDLLLKERTEFDPTPKYLSVTRRLYQPWPDATAKMEVASTFCDSQKETAAGDGDVDRPSILANRHRATTISRFSGDKSTRANFYNTMCTPQSKPRKHTLGSRELNTIAKIGHKTLQTPKQSRGVQDGFQMTAGYTTFKTGSIFKRGMRKEEFAEMKQKVHHQIEANDRTLEEVRSKAHAWKAQNLESSPLACRQSFKMEKAVKMEDIQLSNVTEDQIVKRSKENFKAISRIVANIDLELPRLCNDVIFKKLLDQCLSYYARVSRRGFENESRLCNEFQSNCVKEISFDNLLKVISIMLEAFLRVELSAFKHVLAQVFQWYQRFTDKIQGIADREKDPDLFNDNNVSHNSGAFLHSVKLASKRSSNLSVLNDALGQQTMPLTKQPFTQTTASWQLPDNSPHRFLENGGTDMRVGQASVRRSYLQDQVDEATLIQQRIQAGREAHHSFSNTLDGEVIADSYGNMKFRTVDNDGVVVPNRNLDPSLQNVSIVDGQAEYFHSQQFTSQFYPRVQAEKLRASHALPPPGQEFAHSLVKKYLAAGPISFTVHPQAPVIDLTEAQRDGKTILNEKGAVRRPQQLNIKSDAMNTAMIEVAQKKIGFLGHVKSNNLTQRKMDLVESVRVQMNEFDEKNLQRETIHDNGKNHENEIRKIYQFQQKLDRAKDEIVMAQLAQKTLTSQPIDEVMNKQTLEVEKLKMELARQGVDISNQVLKRGIVLPNREERYTEATDPPTYPNAGAFLMENPHPKQKQKKKKKGADSPLRRRGKMSKARSPTKGGKGSQRASQDSMPSADDEMEGGLC